jgi:hypothetical protein
MISGSKFGLLDESLLDFSELCTLMSSLKVFKFQDLSCASMLGHVSGRLTTGMSSRLLYIWSSYIVKLSAIHRFLLPNIHSMVEHCSNILI